MTDLGAQTEINRLLLERTNVLVEHNRLFGEQTNIVRELCEALSCLPNSSGIAGISGSLNQLSGSVGNITGSLGGMSSQLSNSVTPALGSTKGAIGSVTKGLGTFLKSLISFKWVSGIFKGIWNTAKGIGSLIFGIGKSIFSIVKSIISIPFRIMSGLIAMANDLGGNMAVARALEDIRDKFGNLQYGTANLIKEGFRPMKRELNSLAATGFKFGNIFGYGPEGVAEAIQFLGETMGALGGAAVTLRKQLEGSLGAITIYQKGLGMTAEQQAIIMKTAMASKRPILEMQEDLGHYAVHMARMYGDNSKEIGRAMSEMAADTANYGTLSVKQLSQVAIYTRKLGIETKQLQGIIDKYDDFENAAQAASMLNQTFGMQVDVLKLMREEDPAARLSQLQRSFQATGRSYEKLSRVERKRLADLAGMDENTAKLAFSQHGLSQSYEEIQASGDKTEDTMKTVADTMKELSKNIKRILPDPRQHKSFFDAFTSGFQDGITKGLVAMGLFSNIRSALNVVYRAGREVGKLFLQLFPGVMDMAEALKGLFDPKAEQTKMNKVIAAFKEFFEAIQGGPEEIMKASGKLFDDISAAFISDAEGKLGMAAKFKDGLKKFIIAASNTFFGIVNKVVSLASKLPSMIIEGIKGIKSGEAKKIIDPVGAEISDVLGASFSTGMSSLLTTLQTELWPALKELGLFLWEQIKEQWINFKTWFISDAWPVISNFISCTLAPALKEAWETFEKEHWPGIKSWFEETVWPAITETLPDLLIGAFSAVWDAITSDWRIAAAALGGILLLALTGMVGPAMGALAPLLAIGGTLALGMELIKAGEQAGDMINMAWNEEKYKKGLEKQYSDLASTASLTPEMQKAYNDAKIKVLADFDRGLLQNQEDADKKFEEYVNANYAASNIDKKLKKTATGWEQTTDYTARTESALNELKELERVQEIIDKIKSMGSMDSKLKEAQEALPGPEKLNEIRSKAAGFVESANAVLKTISEEIKKLATDNMVTTDKINQINMFSSFVTQMESVSKSLGEINKFDNINAEATISKAREFAKTLNELDTESLFDSIENLVENMGGNNWFTNDTEDINEKLKSINSAFKTILEVVSSIKSMGEKTKDFQSIKQNMDSIVQSSSYIGSEGVKIYTSMSGLSNFESITENVESFTEYVKSFDKMLISMPTLTKEKVGATMQAFNEAVNQIASNEDLNVVVDIMKGLSGDSTVVFEHKKANFNINVQVRMDAAQITAEVLSTDMGQDDGKIEHNFSSATIKKART